MAIEFEVARCVCGAVVCDGIAVRGLIRLRCAKCRRRVWLQGDGVSLEVIRVDRPPRVLPKAAAS